MSNSHLVNIDIFNHTHFYRKYYLSQDVTEIMDLVSSCKIKLAQDQVVAF